MPKLLAICALLCTIGCNRSTAALLPTPAGNYVLQTIDGKPVPTQQTAGDSILTGGAVLYENGAYAFNWLAPSFYFGQRSLIAVKDTGTWSVASGQVSFSSNSGASWTASFASRSLTVQLTPDTWTFVKP